MVQKATTLTDLNLREILKRIEKRYGVKLPERVVAADLGLDFNDLFLKFSHDEIKEGEPSKDGLVIFHYSQREELVAIEIMDLAEL